MYVLFPWTEILTDYTVASTLTNSALTSYFFFIQFWVFFSFKSIKFDASGYFSGEQNVSQFIGRLNVMRMFKDYLQMKSELLHMFSYKSIIHHTSLCNQSFSISQISSALADLHREKINFAIQTFNK